MFNRAKRKYERKKRLELRLRVLNKYGNSCIKCGFSDYRALQIDHVNGGGGKEIKKFKVRGEYYQHLLTDKTNNYQLLCANCNQIKKCENYENANDRRKS